MMFFYTEETHSSFDLAIFYIYINYVILFDFFFITTFFEMRTQSLLILAGAVRKELIL